MRHHLRWLPALVVLLLLATAAVRPQAPGMAPPPPIFTYCTEISDSGGGAGTVGAPIGAALCQPVPSPSIVAACSLHVTGAGWTLAQVDVREWDPQTLAPDPSAIALRSALFDPSQMQYYTLNSVPALQFAAPVITRCVADVAETPRQTLAITERGLPYAGSAGVVGYFDANGNPHMPPASRVAGDGSATALSGAHPVFAHVLCSGSSDLDELRIGQAVVRTDASFPSAPGEIAQMFRVPEVVDLRWIELALGNVGASGQTSIATVAIVDPAGASEPSPTMPYKLGQSTFTAVLFREPGPRWATPNFFDHTVTLYPGRDYWLYAYDLGTNRLLAATRTGGEPATFNAGIGSTWIRATGSDPWSPVADRALSFKIVGRPAGSVGVPARPGEGIRLAIAPNPATTASVTWSGGVGPVRLEVLDERGRRVHAFAGGAAGTWRWAGVDAQGTALPSGVYFVRARDSQGEQGVQRIVLVR